MPSLLARLVIATKIAPLESASQEMVMTTAFKEPDVRAAGMADPAPMNGAESLARTLAAGGVDVCFANPGTSEMHFVAALDQVDGIRSVLCLFEGVATGAADGYARMTDKPAATLLHLGPGLANGLANLHNAKRARSPVVNIVGEHASFHRKFDAPLTPTSRRWPDLSQAGSERHWIPVRLRRMELMQSPLR